MIFDENVTAAPEANRLDFEQLKLERWIPLQIADGRATVAAADPDDAALEARIKGLLGVAEVRFLAALPEDVVRIIEHNRDVNPGFPATAGRTSLAKVRTYLALRRSQFSAYRTRLSKGRTGLAFLRTGLSFCTASMVLIRVFGFGWLSLVEGALALLGIGMAVDGFLWYKSARGIAKKRIAVPKPAKTGGTTILEVENAAMRPTFRRTDPVRGAELLRAQWAELSPVARRRVLAVERTDLAEERTRLAAYRSVLAKARTGLALTRTGISLVGVGSALLRSNALPTWTFPDLGLIAVGLVMILEGFYWYYPSRDNGKGGLRSVVSPEKDVSAWDVALAPPLRHATSWSAPGDRTPTGADLTQGIFGTTGLALERTVLADRRNVMARFRTALARSRTGMSLIRTGMNFTAVGLGLLVGYGMSSVAWGALSIFLLAVGLFLVGDGHYWHLPVSRWKRQFPYAEGELDILMADYNKPFAEWDKLVFDDEDA